MDCKTFLIVVLSILLLSLNTFAANRGIHIVNMDGKSMRLYDDYNAVSVSLATVPLQMALCQCCLCANTSNNSASPLGWLPCSAWEPSLDAPASQGRQN